MFEKLREELREWFGDVTAPDSSELLRTVTVKKGDSLWKIAEACVGDGSRWGELVTVNPEKHWDYDHTVIHPGEEIKLPKSWE